MDEQIELMEMLVKRGYGEQHTPDFKFNTVF